MILSPSHHALFESVVEVSDKLHMPVYLVGGYTRDLLLSLKSADKDIDLTIEGDAQIFAQHMQTILGGEVRTFDTFKTAKLIKPSKYSEIDEIDFASCRTETYDRSGKLPSVQFSTIAEDLGRRDFSINTLAIELRKLCEGDINSIDELRAIVIDTFGGCGDLENRIIKVLHQKSFTDDPTRLFRAVRYKERLLGTFDPQTESLLHEAITTNALDSISTFRKFSEIKKMCSESRAKESFFVLADKGMLNFLPIKREMKDFIAEVFSKQGDRYKNLLREIFLSLNSAQQSVLAQELNIGKKGLKELFQG